MLAWTHLQVYSHYSLLAGTASVADLVARAGRSQFTALALTDLNVLYGAVAFAKTCQQAAIQPIIGLSVSVAPPEGGLDSQLPPGRITLLAMNPAGYRSLCHISSAIQGHPQRESLAAQGLGWEVLRQETAGLICLSGGRQGWLEWYVRGGNRPAAARYVARLGGLYGENCYLSLEYHRPEDQPIIEETVALGNRFGLPVVAAQPVYCLNPADRPTFRLLAAIQANCRLADVPERHLPAGGDPTVDLHWLEEKEVAARFAKLPQALSQVAEIIKRCGPALPDGRPIWPILPLPHHHTAEQALAEQATAGLTTKMGEVVPAGTTNRLHHELTVISNHGYAPLFLVVADIVRFAREQEIPVSTRGSVANSLVAYAIGITTVDPIAHDLLFERFLNPARANPPDIDLDFCSRRRDEVLDYVRRTYGEERVALVATINTFQPRSAVRETAKVYGLDEETITRLVKKLPSGWHPDPRRREEKDVESIVADVLADNNGELPLGEIIRLAYGLLDQPNHLSVHPGGVVIAPGRITDIAPVQWTAKGFLITQFDHRDVEVLGLPKLDLLGIRALTVLADAAELIRQSHAPHFRLDTIPANDELTANLLSKGDTIGVFQCESAGAQRTLRQLQARTLSDLAVANAFFKPGPALGGMAKSFVRRYRGQERVTYLHPALEPILGSTHGVLLFQEQILRIAREVAGLSWQEADHLRRGMSKFQAAEMAAMAEAFVSGCQATAGLSAPQAQTLWQQILPFAGYGFNRGHATAYAEVSYRSAYLKAHYPAEFLCGRLADWGGFHHQAVYIAEAIRLGIGVQPPHVNHSQVAFSLSRPDTLWMGLGQVRDLRHDTIAALIAGRPFRNLADLQTRVPMQNKELTHLIQCGALDGLGKNRATLLDEAQRWQQAGTVQQLAFAFARPAPAPESEAQRLQWELHLLEQPLTVHPLQLVKKQLPNKVTPLSRLAELPGRNVTIAGARLPGWTGGRGFFLSDGQNYITVRAEKSPRPWQVVVCSGRWLRDEWGENWFQAEGSWEL